MVLLPSRRGFVAGGAASLALRSRGASAAANGGEADGFREVDAAAFRQTIEMAPLSPSFRGQLRKYGEALWDSRGGTNYRVRHGDLVVEGNWSVPSLYCLVVGNVTIRGLCDLQNPPDYDEGGGFAVVGSLRCRALSNLAGGKLVMIDGDLLADEAVLNDAEDSALILTGDLKTRWYQGIDIWAEVGGRCEIDYGDGYCLALDHTDPERQSTRPRHDEAASRAVLAERLRREGSRLRRSLDMRDMLARGDSIFAR